MNVYYLPSTVALNPVSNLAAPTFWERLNTRWWRLRILLAELRAVLRRPAPRFSPEDYAFLGDDVAVMPRVRPTRPAKVIDLETARVRLRPAAQD